MVSSLVARLERHQVPVYLTAVVIGVVAPGADDAFEALIYPVLGALLYATFVQVPFTALRAAFADRRFLVAALGLNFVIVPPIAFALSWLAPDGTAVELGVLLVLLTPCIDYVIVFTRLAGGSDRRLLAASPVLMLAQMALLPGYLWLFMGSELADVVEPGPFVEAFVLLIALPLALAWVTEAWAARSGAGARFKRGVDLTPVALMAATFAGGGGVAVPARARGHRSGRRRGPAVRRVPGDHGGGGPLAGPRAGVRGGCGACLAVHGGDAELAGGAAVGVGARGRVRPRGGGDRHADAGRGRRDARLRSGRAAAAAFRPAAGGGREGAGGGERLGGVEGAEPAAAFMPGAVEKHRGGLAGIA